MSLPEYMMSKTARGGVLVFSGVFLVGAPTCYPDKVRSSFFTAMGLIQFLERHQLCIGHVLRYMYVVLLLSCKDLYYKLVLF